MNYRFIHRALFLIITLLITTGSTMAQSSGRPPEPVGEPKREESIAARKGFKTKIIEVKNRDPRMLADVLRGLGSQEGGALFDINRELKTIIVRDYPEVVSTIEDAVKRLDQPELAPVNLDVQVHLIAAGRANTDKSSFPDGLDAVVTQLQSTLKYKGYRYVTTFLNRVKNEGNVEAKGSTDLIFPAAGMSGKAFYQYSFSDIKLQTDSSGKEAFQVRNFRFDVNTPVPVELGAGNSRFDYMKFNITTELSLREGEMVVVGTANIGSSDEAIIVVLSVKKAR